MILGDFYLGKTTFSTCQHFLVTSNSFSRIENPVTFHIIVVKAIWIITVTVLCCIHALDKPLVLDKLLLFHSYSHYIILTLYCHYAVTIYSYDVYTLYTHIDTDYIDTMLSLYIVTLSTVNYNDFFSCQNFLPDERVSCSLFSDYQLVCHCSVLY